MNNAKWAALAKIIAEQQNRSRDSGPGGLVNPVPRPPQAELPFPMNTYIPKVVDLATNPDNRWGIEKKRKEAAEIYNRSQIQDPYERRAPTGYREALPLGLAAALAKLLGVSDADLGAGFQGFMGAREDAEERRYQNHLAKQSRRQAELLGQARLKELDVQELGEKLARRDAKIAQAKADATSQSVMNAYMKMDRHKRTNFILDQLRAEDPKVAAMLEKMSPDELQAFLGTDDAKVPTAPVMPMIPPNPHMENGMRALSPEVRKRLEAGLASFKAGLNAEQAQMLDIGSSLFDPGLRIQFAREYSGYLNLLRKNVPTSDQISRLLNIIGKQMEVLAARSYYTKAAQQSLELLRDFTDELRYRQAPPEPPPSPASLTGEIPPYQIVPRPERGRRR